jgi:hypothetical protein
MICSRRVSAEALALQALSTRLTHRRQTRNYRVISLPACRFIRKTLSAELNVDWDVWPCQSTKRRTTLVAGSGPHVTRQNGDLLCPPGSVCGWRQGEHALSSW